MSRLRLFTPISLFLILASCAHTPAGGYDVRVVPLHDGGGGVEQGFGVHRSVQMPASTCW